MKILFKKLIKKLLLFSLVIVGCNACDYNESKIRPDFESKFIIEKFEKDAYYIFDSDDIDVNYFSSYNADRIIFQINKTNDDQDFLKQIESRLVEKDWLYKGKYKKAYIYCDKKLNQLELVPPFNSSDYSGVGEGQTLNQLTDYWNISFISSKHRRYVCNNIN